MCVANQPVRSIVFHAMKSRPVVFCRPMIRRVVRRTRRMIREGGGTVSPMKRRSSTATYLRRSAFRWSIIANQLLRFHAGSAITM